MCRSTARAHPLTNPSGLTPFEGAVPSHAVAVVAAAATALIATVFPAVYGPQWIIPNHHAPTPINETRATANLCPIMLAGSTT